MKKCAPMFRASSDKAPAFRRGGQGVEEPKRHGGMMAKPVKVKGKKKAKKKAKKNLGY